MVPEKLILLIDDHQDDIVLMRREFTLVNVRNPILALESADEAVSYLSATNQFCDRRRFPLPALVIVNVHLPCGGGFQVISAVKNDAQLSSIPVVAIGESDRSSDACMAFDLGANLFCPKHLDLRGLVRSISRMECLQEIFVRQKVERPAVRELSVR